MISKEQPAISVIVPVYNTESYLKDCLDSVVNQTLKNIEIICINDGSTDNSLEILNEYARNDERIIVVTKENKGLACTRNSGIDLARGEWIFFLDSDDYLTKDILEKLYLKSTAGNFDIVMSRCSPFADIYDDYTLMRVEVLNKYLTYKANDNLQITSDNFYKIVSNYPCVSCGSLYKKTFLSKNNLKFINKKVIHEDNGFFIKTLSTFPKVCALGDIGIMYRIRAKSISYESEKEENKKIRISQMKIILNDAFEYIKSNNNIRLAKLLIHQVKSFYGYGYCYEIKIPGIFTYLWCKNNKKINILGISIFREKIRKEKYVVKVLGIPVFIKSFSEEC